MYLQQSVKGVLISVHMAFGVKLPGRQYRLLYGTREVTIVLLTEKKKGSSHTGMYEIVVADQIVVVMNLL